MRGGKRISVVDIKKKQKQQDSKWKSDLMYSVSLVSISLKMLIGISLIHLDELSIQKLL